jgi:hypothetical protein
VSKDLLLYATLRRAFVGRRYGAGTDCATPELRTPTHDRVRQHGVRGGSDLIQIGQCLELRAGREAAGSRQSGHVNASAYYERWNGVQQSNSLSSCGYVYSVNAGDAHVTGAELEIQALVLRDLMVSANGSYSHAELVSTGLIDAGFNPGTPIQDVPHWTASASIVYRHPLTGQLTFTARLDDTHVGSRTDATYSINTLPYYDLANFRTGVEAVRWSAALFINNLADKRALLSDSTADAINLPTYNRIAVSQPRTVGIDFNYHFGSKRSRPPLRSGARANRQRHVAQIDVPGIELEPGLTPVAALFEHRAEGRAVGAQHLDRRAFRARQVRRHAQRDDRHARLGRNVEPHLAAPSRQTREQLDALEHSADQCDVTIELPRRMADHRIHFGTVALRRIVAADADHAIAVRQPDQTRARIPPGGKAVDKAHLRGINIAIRQGLEIPADALGSAVNSGATICTSGGTGCR